MPTQAPHPNPSTGHPGCPWWCALTTGLVNITPGCGGCGFVTPSGHVVGHAVAKGVPNLLGLPPNPWVRGLEGIGGAILILLALLGLAKYFGFTQTVGNVSSKIGMLGALV